MPVYCCCLLKCFRNVNSKETSYLFQHFPQRIVHFFCPFRHGAELDQTCKQVTVATTKSPASVRKVLIINFTWTSEQTAASFCTVDPYPLAIKARCWWWLGHVYHTQLSFLPSTAPQWALQGKRYRGWQKGHRDRLSTDLKKRGVTLQMVPKAKTSVQCPCGLNAKKHLHAYPLPSEIQNLSCVVLWRSRPNTRKWAQILLTLPPSKAADMAHLCVPQNQALEVCRGFVPDIQVCGERVYSTQPAHQMQKKKKKKKVPKAAALGARWRFPTAASCTGGDWLIEWMNLSVGVHATCPRSCSAKQVTYSGGGSRWDDDNISTCTPMVYALCKITQRIKTIHKDKRSNIEGFQQEWFISTVCHA